MAFQLTASTIDNDITVNDIYFYYIQDDHHERQASGSGCSVTTGCLGLESSTSGVVSASVVI